MLNNFLVPLENFLVPRRKKAPINWEFLVKSWGKLLVGTKSTFFSKKFGTAETLGMTGFEAFGT
jgi:hypothetical protein